MALPCYRYSEINLPALRALRALREAIFSRRVRRGTLCKVSDIFERLLRVVEIGPVII
jgi:hypothetical protein